MYISLYCHRPSMKAVLRVLGLVVIWGNKELGMTAAVRHGKDSKGESGCGEGACQKQLPRGWLRNDPAHLFPRKIQRKVTVGWRLYLGAWDSSW